MRSEKGRQETQPPRLPRSRRQAARSRRSPLAGLVAAISLLAAGSVPAAAGEQPAVTGLVTGPSNAPLSRVRVILRNEDTGETRAVSTNRSGRFNIEHDACSKCSLTVRPDGKSGLACAVIEDIAGKGQRQFVVHLKRGFSVSGRVVSGGRPVKGVKVEFLPGDAEARTPHSVHASGSDVTGRDGRFHVVLTPGEKVLLVSSDRNVGLEQVKQELTVTHDLKLPDVSIPEPR